MATSIYASGLERSMSILIALIFYLAALAPLSASAADSSLIDGAKREGSVVFYTTMDIQNSSALVEAFSKKYPFIKGDLVRLGGTAMVSRIVTEAQAGANRFDVAVGISPS